MNNKIEQIQPYWVESQQGVYIPLINKVLLKDNVPIMPYKDYMEYARYNKVQIATKDELLQMYLQKNEINKILKEHNGNTLAFDWFGSSSEHHSYSVWAIHFDTGCSTSVFKDISYLSRAVVGLKKQK